MRQFGINILTGERCAYGMRLLCDVNEDGAALMKEYLGVTGFQPNWNSTVDDKPAVGSVMLDRDSLPRLAQFAMFRAGALAVFVDCGSITPITEPDRLEAYVQLVQCERFESATLIRNPALNSNQPHVGSRNVHAFSGRVE
jgi:hypothetical protein